MKKNLTNLLFALPMLLLATFMAGCNTEDVDPVVPELEIAESASGDALSSLTLNFGSDESSSSFYVRCNRNWTAVSSDKDWAVVSAESGDSNAQLTVSVTRNTGTSRSATITVSTILLKKTIYIEQAGETADAKVIYFDNLDGTAAAQDASGKWPYANEFDGYNKVGTGIAGVTYSSSSVTVRSNSTSNDTKYNTSDYSAKLASGLNNLYFSGGGTFTVNKIALDGETSLQITFGVERNEYGNYDADFNPAEFIVSLSADGNTWVPLTYTRSTYSAWDMATADFTLKEAPEYLYIKMAASVATRVDDIKLTTGTGGAEIDLNAGEPEPEPDPTVDGTLLYYESFDGATISATTGIDAFETAGGFVRQGIGGATAIYAGTNFDIRNTQSSMDYDGASAGNNAFGNKVDAELTVDNISVGNAVNLDLTFGLRAYNAFDANNFELYYTTDAGTTYKQLTYTRSSADKGWALVSVSFNVAESDKTIGLKFVSKIAGEQFRIDDITLSTEDENIVIDNIPVVQTAAAEDITKSGATLGGSYVFSGSISEAGVAYKASGASDYTYEKAIALSSPFSVTLNTLDSGTSYEYYAYVVADGTEYKGAVLTFSTLQDLSATVTYFIDDFAGAVNNKPYESGKWSFFSNDSAWPSTDAYRGWHGRVFNNDGYIACAPYNSELSEVVAYAVMTKFNVADAQGKKLTFDMAWYYQTKDNSKFEIVASKNFDGDASAATWEVVEAFTYTDEAQNEWSTKSVDLSKNYASETALAVAFRYTGKSNTYRVDNVEFGATDTPAEKIAVTTVYPTSIGSNSAKLKGSYSGVTTAPTEVGIEYRLYGGSDYTKKAAAQVSTDFEVEVTDLVEETQYEFRAYAVWNGETVYGSEMTFVTNAAVETVTPIADVELNGTYTMEGTVTALSSRGFILTDNSASILFYNASYNLGYKVGQKLTVTGSISAYSKGLQIDGSTAVITEGELGSYTYPTPATADAAAIDAFIANTDNRLATYVSLTGDVTVSGNYYNITVDGTTNQGSIYYPTDEIKAAITTGTNITVKGYAVSVSSSRYYNLVATEVVTNTASAPTIELSASALSFAAEGETKTATITTASQGDYKLFAKSSDEHFVPTIEGTTLSIAAAANTESAAKTATVTVYLAEAADAEAVASAEIACSQAAAGEVTEPTEQIVYSTGFESSEGFASGTVYNNAEAVAFGNDGEQWNTVYGTASTTSPITGSQSMQMRWYTSAQDVLGYTYTNFDIENVTKVEFTAKNTNGLNVAVSYSTDGGQTWLNAQNITLTTAKASYTYTISETGLQNVRLKFQIVLPETAPTATSRMFIDDINVYGMK